MKRASFDNRQKQNGGGGGGCSGVCVWGGGKSGVTIWCLPQLLFSLFFETESLMELEAGQLG